jgi:hypothetical protein
VGSSVPRRQLCASQKRGGCVGETKRGKATKVMLVADGNGLPIGLKQTSVKRIRLWLLSMSIKLTIPPYERRARKRPKLGRLVKVGLGYKECWKVERTFTWLGNVRRLLMRHERYLSTFRASSSLPSSSCC